MHCPKFCNAILDYIVRNNKSWKGIIISEIERIMILYVAQKLKEKEKKSNSNLNSISNNKLKLKLKLRSKAKILKNTSSFSVFSFFFFFLATSVRTINSIRVSTGIFFGEKVGKFSLPLINSGRRNKFSNICYFYMTSFIVNFLIKFSIIFIILTRFSFLNFVTIFFCKFDFCGFLIIFLWFYCP